MARNIQIQILRGTEARLQDAMPLALGEQYFATDTGNFFLGTPGYGLGYAQIGDTTEVNETLKKLLLVMESMRRAIVALACDGGKNKPVDFDITTISSESGIDSVDD